MVRRTVAIVALLIAFCVPAFAGELEFLHADGWRIAEASGRPVTLKGINLGNWFMIEPWMFGGCLDATDQDQIFTTLRRRFGDDGEKRLIDLYRSGYVTSRDFELIKSFGFNLVRLPFDYRIIQSDVPPYPIKADAFEWLDHAVGLAESAGVYVILDLHGAPGGQSDRMHTGKAGVNQLFAVSSDQDRTVAIWHALSEHFKNRATVAAYDLLNEPYGDFKQDLRPGLLKLMPRLYETIRATGDEHLMFFPGTLKFGIEFYGDPHSRHWRNVGFTEHTYAGLFGKDKPTVQNHVIMLTKTFSHKRDYVDRLGVPYYLGEFNVVIASAGGASMMRRYYDTVADFGWPATMWSYKLLKPRGGETRDKWYAVTNGGRLPRLDLESSSYADFESFFRNLAIMDLTVNQPLRQALTEPHPVKDAPSSQPN